MILVVAYLHFVSGNLEVSDQLLRLPQQLLLSGKIHRVQLHATRHKRHPQHGNRQQAAGNNSWWVTHTHATNEHRAGSSILSQMKHTKVPISKWGDALVSCFGRVVSCVVLSLSLFVSLCVCVFVFVYLCLCICLLSDWQRGAAAGDDTSSSLPPKTEKQELLSLNANWPMVTNGDSRRGGTRGKERRRDACCSNYFAYTLHINNAD